MQLKNIICHLDALHDVRIYTEDSDTDAEFEGGVLDIPWIYLDYELDTTKEYEAISITSAINEHGVRIYYFNINLKSPESITNTPTIPFL